MLHTTLMELGTQSACTRHKDFLYFVHYSFSGNGNISFPSGNPSLRFYYFTEN